MAYIDDIIEEAEESGEEPEKPKMPAEPEYSDGQVAIYAAFREQVYDPKSVLHPCCGFDASPARVFPNVTFVDMEDGNEGAIEALRKHGLKALKMDIREYMPEEEHDLLILLNSAIPTGWASQHIASGAFILSNNYHGNAAEMWRERSRYKPWGTIDFAEKDRRKGDNRVVVSRDLEGLFEPVESGEELKRLRPSFYDFVMTSYPHILRSMGVEPKTKFEELYVQFHKMMGESTIFPSKRKAEMYIFVKR
jgi:hypothetical protein